MNDAAVITSLLTSAVTADVAADVAVVLPFVVVVRSLMDTDRKRVVNCLQYANCVTVKPQLHVKQESRAVARKPRDAGTVRCGLKFADIHYKSESQVSETPPIFHAKFEGVPIGLHCRYWSEEPKLIIRVTTFELTQLIWSQYLNVTDRQTDGRTTYDSSAALCTMCIARQ